MPVWTGIEVGLTWSWTLQLNVSSTDRIAERVFVRNDTAEFTSRQTPPPIPCPASYGTRGFADKRT